MGRFLETMHGGMGCCCLIFCLGGFLALGTNSSRSRCLTLQARSLPTLFWSLFASEAMTGTWVSADRCGLAVASPIIILPCVLLLLPVALLIVSHPPAHPHPHAPHTRHRRCLRYLCLPGRLSSLNVAALLAPVLCPYLPASSHNFTQAHLPGPSRSSSSSSGSPSSRGGSLCPTPARPALFLPPSQPPASSSSSCGPSPPSSVPSSSSSPWPSSPSSATPSSTRLMINMPRRPSGPSPRRTCMGPARAPSPGKMG